MSKKITNESNFTCNEVKQNRLLNYLINKIYLYIINELVHE